MSPSAKLIRAASAGEVSQNDPVASKDAAVIVVVGGGGEVFEDGSEQYNNV